MSLSPWAALSPRAVSMLDTVFISYFLLDVFPGNVEVLGEDDSSHHQGFLSATGISGGREGNLSVSLDSSTADYSFAYPRASFAYRVQSGIPVIQQVLRRRTQISNTGVRKLRDRSHEL